jgi:DNA-binding PadR family transcriptional regulator
MTPRQRRPNNADVRTDGGLPLTSYATLGLLRHGHELTAIEIEESAHLYLRFFYWTPALSHIRRELSRLEELGYVDCREVVTGRIKRTLKYWLTPAGEAALKEWVESTFVEQTVQKNSAILRLWLGRRGADPEAVLEGLDAHIEFVKSERESLRAVIVAAEHSYQDQLSDAKGASGNTREEMRLGLWRHAWVLEIMQYCLREYDNEVENLNRLMSDMRRLVAQRDSFFAEELPSISHVRQRRVASR